jgi:ubiquinone biosynthesis protein
LEGGGLDVHLRADEIEPLVLRAERLGNRVVAGVIAAAFIEGLAELMAVDPERWRSWERPMFTFGIGAVGALGGYLAWTGRRAAHRRR